MLKYKIGDLVFLKDIPNNIGVSKHILLISKFSFRENEYYGSPIAVFNAGDSVYLNDTKRGGRNRWWFNDDDVSLLTFNTLLSIPFAEIVFVPELIDFIKKASI